MKQLFIFILFIQIACPGVSQNNQQVGSGIFTITSPPLGNSDLSSIRFTTKHGIGRMEYNLDSADLTLDMLSWKSVKGMALTDVIRLEDVKQPNCYRCCITADSLDKIFAKQLVKIPKKGFSTEGSLFSNDVGQTYIIKTQENKYALLMLVCRYIGGFDRFTYYWMYPFQIRKK